MLFSSQHSNAMVSTVTSQQAGPGFKSTIFGVWIFLPCLCGFSTGPLASSHSLEDVVIGVRLIGDPKFPIFVNVCANGCLPATGVLSRVFSVSCPLASGTGSSPHTSND